MTTDLKQERLCKKTTLWADCGQKVRKKKEVRLLGKDKKSFFFLENTEAYKVINILSKKKEERNRRMDKVSAGKK